MITRRQMMDTLEALLLDAGQGPDAILGALSEVCLERAEHVQTNWQDNDLAEAWSRLATQLALAATAREMMDLSAVVATWRRL